MSAVDVVSLVTTLICSPWLLFILIRWHRRALKAEAREDAWKRLCFKSIEDVAKACHSSMTACEAIKSAIAGRHVWVTKPAEGMTLFEAQQTIDEILAPFYPPKGNA